MSVVRRSLGLAAAVWLVGCATSGGADPSVGGDRLRLTAEELRAEQVARTLDEVIRRQRPHWLTARGAASLRDESSELVVYLDGVRAGGPAVLRTLLVETVETAHFLSAAEATTRFGTGHLRGAILVVTRRR